MVFIEIFVAPEYVTEYMPEVAPEIYWGMARNRAEVAPENFEAWPEMAPKFIGDRFGE